MTSKAVETKDDLHSYLRHSLPGYVFLIIVGIYALISNGSDILRSVKWSGILAIIGAGFPLGYLLQSAFRGIFVLTLLPRTLNREGAAIEEAIGSASFNLHFTGYAQKEKLKAAAWAFEMFLNSEENEGYQKRFLHLISVIHAAGGVISAIFFAHLAFWGAVFMKEAKCEVIKNGVCAMRHQNVICMAHFVFLVLAILLLVIFCDYRNSFQLSMRSFVLSRGVAFETFLTKFKKTPA